MEKIAADKTLFRSFYLSLVKFNTFNCFVMKSNRSTFIKRDSMQHLIRKNSVRDDRSNLINCNDHGCFILVENMHKYTTDLITENHISRPNRRNRQKLRCYLSDESSSPVGFRPLSCCPIGLKWSKKEFIVLCCRFWCCLGSTRSNSGVISFFHRCSSSSVLVSLLFRSIDAIDVKSSVF